MLALALLVLAACTPLTEANSDFVEARQRWKRFGPSSYEITIGHGCFCLPDVTRPVIVTVSDGQVVRRRYVDDDTNVDARWAEAFPTVDGPFAVIADAFDRNAASVNATYHPSWGYPVSVGIDYEAQMADDESFFSADGLVPR
jgi:hypothetical protein